MKIVMDADVNTLMIKAVDGTQYNMEILFLMLLSGYFKITFN